MSDFIAQATFGFGQVTGASIVEFIRNGALGFEPQRVRWRGSRGMDTNATVRALDRLSTDARADAVSVAGPNGCRFGLVRALGAVRVDHVTWVAPGPPDHEALDVLVNTPGLHAAYVADDEDVFWQSTESVDEYEDAGRDHGSLKKRLGAFDEAEAELVDIRVNPGRSRHVAGLWVVAGQRMWFGPASFELFDRERLLGWPGSELLEGSGVVSVELFPYEWYATQLEAVRERQQAFRDHVNMDLIEARHEELTLRALEDDHTADGLAPTQSDAGGEEAVTNIVNDAVTAAKWAADALRQSGYAANFSAASAYEVDRFFDEHMAAPGQPRADGLLAEDVGARLFAIGSYVGEVVRRSSNGWQWVPSQESPDDETNLTLRRNDETIWPIQRAMKRYSDGAEAEIVSYVESVARG